MSGDIDGNWSDMAYQVKAMQSAGISGFPYFNHDAGGHLNVTVNEDNLYRQWDMGFGSFTPIWKPHGPSHRRWPLQRNATCQATAKTFTTTRYQMIRYIYSYARIAQATGLPMARPMFLEDQTNATAWQKELQYMWGKEMLVAPNFSDGGNSVSVWLPKGNWYYFWDDKKYAGDKTESISAATGVVPAFVKEGAIIPMAPFAKSIFFIPKDTLSLADLPEWCRSLGCWWPSPAFAGDDPRAHGRSALGSTCGYYSDVMIMVAQLVLSGQMAAY